MYDELFDYLSKKGFKVGKVNETLAKMNDADCLKLIEYCNEVINQNSISRERDSLFNFIASDSLSGGSSSCAMPECRIKRIDSLSRFASLYANKVIIVNPFHKYHITGKQQKCDKMLLQGDLEVLLRAKPLIQNNLALIGKNEIHLCSECLKKTLQREKELSIQFKKGELALEGKYLKKMKFKSEFLKGMLTVAVYCPDDFITHTSAFVVKRQHHFYNDLYRIASSSSKEIKNKNTIQYFFHALIAPAITDMFLQDIYTRDGFHSLTDIEADIFIRSKLEGNKTNIEKTNILGNLTHALPDIQKINIEDLIKIRLYENETFQVYRDNLQNLVRKVEKNKIDNDEAKQLFRNEITPELNKIELLFKENRKSASYSIINKAIIGSGFISLGLFSGFLSTNLGAILTALGGYEFLNTAVEDLSKLKETPKDIRTNKYYFLWKLKHS